MSLDRYLYICICIAYYNNMKSHDVKRMEYMNGMNPVSRAGIGMARILYEG